MSRRGGGRPATPGRLLVRAPAALGVTLGAALLLAACSSGTKATPRTTTTTTSRRSRSTTTTTTTAPRSTTTTTTARSTTTSTSAVAAGGTTCQPSELSAAVGQGTGAAGTQALTVSLTNTSTSTCTLAGYPGMQLLDAQGADITTTVVRGDFQFPYAAANQAPASVTLAPGAGATFALAYEDVPVGGETSCPVSSQAELTPPNDTGHLVIPLAIEPCDNGTVHVSPVYPSS